MFYALLWNVLEPRGLRLFMKAKHSYEKRFWSHGNTGSILFIILYMYQIQVYEENCLLRDDIGKQFWEQRVVRTYRKQFKFGLFDKCDTLPTPKEISFLLEAKYTYICIGIRILNFKTSKKMENIFLERDHATVNICSLISVCFRYSFAYKTTRKPPVRTKFRNSTRAGIYHCLK